MILSDENSLLLSNSEESDNFEEKRDGAKMHPPAEAPLCVECAESEAAFFDLSCLKCLQLLVRPQTTISQIFGVMRQWNPHTQRSIKYCTQMVLERNGHINDRDSVSDMTLLHFACKAGAAGIGDPQIAAEVVQDLISRGADVFARCRWTQMTPLHYAALFDSAPIVSILLNGSRCMDIDTACNEHENGSPLHIAAANLALSSARVLVQFGANLKLKDNLARTPFDCVPDVSKYEHVPHMEEIIIQMKELLANETSSATLKSDYKMALESVAGKAMLRTMMLNIGDRVLVDNCKGAILRYCGTVEFASGVWVGVELDTADGKNDGIIKGTLYFKCSPNHGLFLPLNRVSKFPSAYSVTSSSTSSLLSPTKISTSTSANSLKSGDKQEEIRLNDSVMVTTLNRSRYRGVVRFIGVTKFASGTWYGIELDHPDGRNNGSVQGVRYFSCPHRHGMFATVSKLEKIVGEVENREPIKVVTLERRKSLNLSGSKTLTRPVRRSLSTQHRALDPSPLKPSLSLNKSLSTSRLNMDSPKPEWQSINLQDSQKALKKRSNSHWLDLGMNVLFHHKVGVIKYIGSVLFAEGNWLGLEMRDAVGRHDGEVQGYRYFLCKPNRGVMVRPSAVTVRGINGATLIQPQ